jgi:hypothetical protein
MDYLPEGAAADLLPRPFFFFQIPAQIAKTSRRARQ